MKYNILFIICLSILTLLVLLIIFQPKKRVDWCTIQYPNSNIKGTELLLKVKIEKKIPKAYLKVDLHWVEKNKSGFLQYNPVKFQPEYGQHYIYKFTTKKNIKYSKIFAVIFLTPSGKWQDSILTAASPEIQLLNHSTNTKVLSSKISMKEERPFSMIFTTDRPDTQDNIVGNLLHISILLLYLGVILLYILFIKKEKIHITRFDKLISIFFLIAFIGLFIIELTNIAEIISQISRRIFKTQQYYHNRRIFQRITLVIMLAFWYIFLFITFINKKKIMIHKITIASSSALILLKGVSFLSLHSIDELLSRTIFTISVLNLLEIPLLLVIIMAMIKCFHFKK